jgi:hypothetical protein
MRALGESGVPSPACSPGGGVYRTSAARSRASTCASSSERTGTGSPSKCSRPGVPKVLPPAKALWTSMTACSLPRSSVPVRTVVRPSRKYWLKWRTSLAGSIAGLFCRQNQSNRPILTSLNETPMAVETFTTLQVPLCSLSG